MTNQGIKDILASESPSNEDLRYIIRWVPESRAAAWDKLLTQSPSNEDLRYIIEYVPESRAAAGLELRKNFGLLGARDEKELLKSIAEYVIANPDTLEMAHWHTCQTTHCVGGHAVLLAKGGVKAGRYMAQKPSPPH